MKLKTVVILVLTALLGVVSLAVAQTPADEDPAENICYDGGLWEGKCGDWPTEAEIEWAWTCGWYFAQSTAGRIPLSAIPSYCPSLAAIIENIVPEPEPEPEVPFVGCLDSTDFTQYDLSADGPINTLDNATLVGSTDGTCDSGSVGTATIVSGSTPINALAQCIDLRGTTSVGVLNLNTELGYTVTDTWWLCYLA